MAKNQSTHRSRSRRAAVERLRVELSKIESRRGAANGPVGEGFLNKRLYTCQYVHNRLWSSPG
jgi:hypothetical protein